MKVVHSDTIFDPIDAFVSNYKSGTNFTAPLEMFLIRQRFSHLQNEFRHEVDTFRHDLDPFRHDLDPKEVNSSDLDITPRSAATNCKIFRTWYDAPLCRGISTLT